MEKAVLITADLQGLWEFANRSLCFDGIYTFREFFFLLSHEMFSPAYCLFEYSTHDNYTLQINAASGINPEHLDYFRFVGRCLGLAIFHRQLIDAYFVSALYKMMLRKVVSLSDLEGVDATLYRSMVWILYVTFDE